MSCSTCGELWATFPPNNRLITDKQEGGRCSYFDRVAVPTAVRLSVDCDESGDSVWFFLQSSKKIIQNDLHEWVRVPNTRGLG